MGANCPTFPGKTFAELLRIHKNGGGVGVDLPTMLEYGAELESEVERLRMRTWYGTPIEDIGKGVFVSLDPGPLRNPEPVPLVIKK